MANREQIMRKFPSINQFRHVVETVGHKATYIGQSQDDLPMYDKTRPLPTLTFTGTVKLHGTNGGVAFDVNTGKMIAQSRERELTIADDNHGFCKWVESDSGSHSLMRIFQMAQAIHKHPLGVATLHAFGEWCGPSVNGKTAIGQLPERFVIFAILATNKDGSEHWMDVSEVSKAFNMYSVQPAYLNFSSDFKTWTIEIDFSNPEAALDALEDLTLEVEACCPAAKQLGKEGFGEGIVWECDDSVYGRLIFKTKGEKHKGTKNRRLVDVAPEVLQGRDAFVSAVLTESRLQQALDLIISRHGKATLDHLGDFLMWIGKDVMKEEGDTLKASGLDRKDVMSLVNRRAKEWVATRLSRF